MGFLHSFTYCQLYQLPGHRLHQACRFHPELIERIRFCTYTLVSIALDSFQQFQRSYENLVVNFLWTHRLATFQVHRATSRLGALVTTFGPFFIFATSWSVRAFFQFYTETLVISVQSVFAYTLCR